VCKNEIARGGEQDRWTGADPGGLLAIVLVLKVFENINYLLYSSYYIVLQILILFFL